MCLFAPRKPRSVASTVGSKAELQPHRGQALSWPFSNELVFLSVDNLVSGKSGSIVGI